jgi:hypothetical protein
MCSAIKWRKLFCVHLFYVKMGIILSCFDVRTEEEIAQEWERHQQNRESARSNISYNRRNSRRNSRYCVLLWNSKIMGHKCYPLLAQWLKLVLQWISVFCQFRKSSPARNRRRTPTTKAPRGEYRYFIFTLIAVSVCIFISFYLIGDHYQLCIKVPSQRFTG